jgi:hypothetical protein
MTRSIIVVGIVVFLLTSSSTIAFAARTDETAATSSSQHLTSLTVKSEESDGRGLVRIPLIFSHQGNVTIKETPATLSIPSNIQNYTITAPDMLYSNLDNLTFDHWLDNTNSTDRTKTISIPSDNNGVSSGPSSENLTAIYRFITPACDGCRGFLHEGFAQPLVIRIVDSEGNLLNGAGVTVAPKTGVLMPSSGFSPAVTFSNLKNAETYVVSVPTAFVGNNFISIANSNSTSDSSSSRIYHFDHWQGIDGYHHYSNNTYNIEVTIYSSPSFFADYDIILTAVYDKGKS